MATGTRDDVKQRATQIMKAGLEGASIVAQATGSQRHVIDRGSTPIDAALQYIDRVHGPDIGPISPIALHEWALEAGLWDL